MFEQAVRAPTHTHTLGSLSPPPPHTHLETLSTKTVPGQQARGSHYWAASSPLGRRRSPAQPNAPDRATFSLAGGGALSSPEHCTAATILAQRQTARARRQVARRQPRTQQQLDTGTQSGGAASRPLSSAPHTRLGFTRTHTRAGARTQTRTTQQSTPGQGVGEGQVTFLLRGAPTEDAGAPVSSRDCEYGRRRRRRRSLVADTAGP